MELYETIRNLQTRVINQNKASIVVNRITRTSDGAGGWTDTASTLAAQDVRIYAKLRYTKVVSNNEAGWTLVKTQRMIAAYNANLQSESATYLDKFSYNSKTYKIVDVQDVLTQNQIVFKQCEVEAIT